MAEHTHDVIYDNRIMVGSYPWHLLASVGDRLTITGAFLDDNIKNCQTAASSYATRRGWRFVTRRTGENRLVVIRKA